MAGLSDAAYDYHNCTELLGMMLFQAKAGSTVPIDYKKWMNSAPEELKKSRTQASEITLTNPYAISNQDKQASEEDIQRYNDLLEQHNQKQTARNREYYKKHLG